MPSRIQWDSAVVVDGAALLVTAPILYFSTRFPAWLVYAALALLAVPWGWRRFRLGIWRAHTPADWPLFVLAAMLPVALWAAPGPLRTEISWPRAYILIWNYCLFWAVVTHGSRSWRLFTWAAAGFFAAATAIALAAPFGIDWLYKFRPLRPLLDRIPATLVGVFRGAESGFHPNQVAGTLLYALPLMLALSAGLLAAWRRGRRPGWAGALLLLATAIVGGVLLLTQSRAALLGLAVAAIFMALAPWRWGRWALAVGAVLLLLGLPFVSAPLLDQLGGAPPVEALGGTGTLGFRQDVWSQAVAALHDFPFTGTGLGAFRRIVFVLYPIQISPTYDVAHAHNFFLQTGLDFGLPGLVALIALYLVAAAVLVRSWKHLGKGGAARWWVLGLGGSLVAQIVYGQLDTVAMGAKTNLLFWYGVALMLTLCLHWPSRIVSREDHACLRGAGSSGGKG